MITIPVDIKIFLKDDTSYVLKYRNEVLQKVKYSNDLIILYIVKDDDFKLNHCELLMVGIFSLSSNSFVLYHSEYAIDKLFEVDEGLNKREDITPFNFYNLQRELENLTCSELENILELQVKTNTNISKEIEEEAISCFKNNYYPSVDLSSYKVDLTFSNFEQFVSDKYDFAFNCAEKIFNENPNLLKDYQHFKDVTYALEELKNGNRLDLTLYEELNSLSTDSSRKNYNIVLTTDGVNEERLDSVPIKNIMNYPYYAIKKVYWGRKLLFSLDNYDAQKVKELREDVAFNIDMFKNTTTSPNLINGHYYLDYVDESLFKSYDFCKQIIKNASTCYPKIDKSFKENISFIKEALNKVYIGTIISNVSESFILQNEDFFLSLLENNEDAFKYFPISIRERDSFILKLIEVNGKYALNAIPDSKINQSDIQDALTHWFDCHPILSANFYSEDLNISRLRDSQAILNALSIRTISKLDISYLNDNSFMNKFLDKLESNSSNKTEGFSIVYSHLDKLKNDKTFVLRLFKVFNLSESNYQLLDDSLKKDKDIQRALINNNAHLLYLVDEDLQEETVLKDAHLYLPFTIKNINGRHRHYSNEYDDKWFIKIAKSSINNPRNLGGLEFMNYQQSSDLTFAKKLIKINPKAYQYLCGTMKNNEEIAKDMIQQGVSIIPMLPKKDKYNKSLFDNLEIMKACIKISPLDFSDIPIKNKRIPEATILNNKDFILLAMKGNAYNANYLDKNSPFREDADVAKTAILGDIEQSINFASKLFREEDFVYSIMDEVVKYDYNGCEQDIQDYILSRVPKKIKNSKEFIAKYPKFKEA